MQALAPTMVCWKAVKIGLDGRRTDYGIVSFWHRNPLRRWLFRFAKAIGGTVLADILVIPLIGLATVFTHAGKAIVTNKMINAGTDAKFVAWGTGAGVAAVGDTTLFTESPDEARGVGAMARITIAQPNDTYQASAVMQCAVAGKTITNAGLFDAAAAGNLLMKGDFAGIALIVGEQLQLTGQLQFT